jgi:PII-like signaling protein
MPDPILEERTLLRIYIGERDHSQSDLHHGAPLSEALLALFRERGLAGATVLRGVRGFGASRRVHEEHLLELSLDLPLVVEAVDREEAIQQLLPEVGAMVGDGGLMTLERVRVVGRAG